MLLSLWIHPNVNSGVESVFNRLSNQAYLQDWVVATLLSLDFFE